MKLNNWERKANFKYSTAVFYIFAFISTTPLSLYVLFMFAVLNYLMNFMFYLKGPKADSQMRQQFTLWNQWTYLKVHVHVICIFSNTKQGHIIFSKHKRTELWSWSVHFLIHPLKSVDIPQSACTCYMHIFKYQTRSHYLFKTQTNGIMILVCTFSRYRHLSTGIRLVLNAQYS